MRKSKLDLRIIAARCDYYSTEIKIFQIFFSGCADVGSGFNGDSDHGMQLW